MKTRSSVVSVAPIAIGLVFTLVSLSANAFPARGRVIVASVRPPVVRCYRRGPVVVRPVVVPPVVVRRAWVRPIVHRRPVVVRYF